MNINIGGQRLDWQISIEVKATSFDLLKQRSVAFLREIEKAKFFNDIPEHSGGGGDGVNEVSYNVKKTSPVEVRVAELRRQADELEATLGK